MGSRDRRGLIHGPASSPCGRTDLPCQHPLTHLYSRLVEISHACATGADLPKLAHGWGAAIAAVAARWLQCARSGLWHRRRKWTFSRLPAFDRGMAGGAPAGPSEVG